MAKRPQPPTGMPWLSPYLAVRDADQSLAFYQKAFGFEKKGAIPGPNGKTGHAEMTWRGSVIMFGPEGAYPSTEGKVLCPKSSGTPSPVHMYVYCDDVDAMFVRATAAGAVVNIPPTDMFWGDRLCKVTDPDGHVWNFATNVADFDPTKMPK